jgi:hypothetical protein
MASSKALSNKDMNGLKVTNLGAPTNGSTDAARKVDLEAGVATAQSRATHSGTQLASSISDFDTQVRTTRLDQMAAPTASVSANNQQLINVADPGTAQAAATKNYVDTQLAGLVSGQTLKGTVRVANTAGNVNTASPGAAIDGVALVAGDLVLLTAQTTTGQNGPWVWNGAAVAMTRPANWDTTVEATLGSYWVVREGTKADNFALLTNDTAITITGTTAAPAPAFTFFSAVGGSAPGRFNVDCPAIAAGATWTVTHNLGSTDVHVVIKRVASPFDFIEDVFISTPDANTVNVIPDIALAAAEFRAIVKF